LDREEGIINKAVRYSQNSKGKIINATLAATTATVPAMAATLWAGSGKAPAPLNPEGPPHEFMDDGLLLVG
jgi:hypothetical protein